RSGRSRDEVTSALTEEAAAVAHATWHGAHSILADADSDRSCTPVRYLCGNISGRQCPDSEWRHRQYRFLFTVLVELCATVHQFRVVLSVVSEQSRPHCGASCGDPARQLVRCVWFCDV